jgi:hypothetical protein
MNSTLDLGLTTEQVEQRIREDFEKNYERLRMEGGHALTPDVKEAALQQALLYWQKLREVAESVTDTEVKLTLPGQITPHDRKYTIEGIVDIVRDSDRTIMYDIKTHDADYVRDNLFIYEQQLNVYAYIWQELRGQPLDQTAIIATAFPDTLQEAISRGDEIFIQQEMARWEPLVEIPLDQQQVAETIRDFGQVVDAIEEKRFAPPSVQKLKEKVGNTASLFATRVCRNCDARFSCSSYRDYALSSSHKKELSFSQYFNDFGSDAERSDRITATLAATPPPEDTDEA